MEKKYYIGNCSICKQGVLEVVKDLETKNIYVCCDECEAEWDDPKDAIEGKIGSRNRYGRTTNVSYDEILKKKWEKYLI